MKKYIIEQNKNKGTKTTYNLIVDKKIVLKDEPFYLLKNYLKSLDEKTENKKVVESVKFFNDLLKEWKINDCFIKLDELNKTIFIYFILDTNELFCAKVISVKKENYIEELEEFIIDAFFYVVEKDAEQKIKKLEDKYKFHDKQKDHIEEQIRQYKRLLKNKLKDLIRSNYSK